MNNKERDRMQHHPVQVTEGGHRAMQRVMVPAPTKVRPYEWIKLAPKVWLWTNDGSVNQYKAQVHHIPGNRYEAIIRTLSRVQRGHQQFMSLEAAQDWAMMEVYDLIQKDFDFYGPDKLVSE